MFKNTDPGQQSKQWLRILDFCDNMQDNSELRHMHVYHTNLQKLTAYSDFHSNKNHRDKSHLIHNVHGCLSTQLHVWYNALHEANVLSDLLLQACSYIVHVQGHCYRSELSATVNAVKPKHKPYKEMLTNHGKVHTSTS